ncbi:MAG: type III-B CRISPR module-associated Cmr3 family protein [Thermoanaerobaculia bacterium]
MSAANGIIAPTDSQWTSYRLLPDDVLFFRDGKPSTIGEDHYLHSIFPLFPSTLYGAIRTARLVEEGQDLPALNGTTWSALSAELRAEIGEWGQFGTLELRGPWLIRGDEVMFPAPADLGVIAESVPADSSQRLRERASLRAVRVLRFRPDGQRSGSDWSHEYRTLRPYDRSGGSWIEWTADAPDSSAGWFLTTRGMESWIAGAVPDPAELVHASELWLTEVRTGVGLEESTRTARKGRLYTFGFIRLHKGVGIGFELRNGALSHPARVRLGGEGKTARLERGVPLRIHSHGADTLGPQIRTVYLATPTFSREGSHAPSSLQGSIAAAVRGSSLVGGWDLAARAPKALRRAIPAGSVFFVENGPEGGVDHLHGTNVSDTIDAPAGLQGFGLALVGTSD